MWEKRRLKLLRVALLYASFIIKRGGANENSAFLDGGNSRDDDVRAVACC